MALARLTTAAFLLGCVASVSAAPQGDDDFWLDYVPGRFAFVGRRPDNGSAYAGSAVISRTGNGFTLERRLGTRVIRARGTIEVPRPPGHGKVLRFAWRDGTRKEMTCLVSGDLDNYPRLSCYWTVEGAAHRAPGLEAYFSTESWPTIEPPAAAEAGASGAISRPRQ